MPIFADTEVQERILREMRKLYEKRRKLELGIRFFDMTKSLGNEKDASVDIDAYRALHLRHQILSK